MKARILVIVLAVAVLFAQADLTPACSLCQSGAMLAPTFRQEAALPTARVILHGTLSNPRLVGDGIRGQTDFSIKTVLRSAPQLRGKDKLVLDGYHPINKGETPHYLVFCDVATDKLDPYRMVRVRDQATAAYVKKALALTDKDTVNNLSFFFGHLDDADAEVARDAFLEFARAADGDIARVAPRLDHDKLRAWINDPKTPAARLGVFALLLGGQGKPADADYLRGLLDSKEQRYQDAFDGLLAGYMQLRPKEAWTLAQQILADGKKSFTQRLAVLRTMRFAYGSHPKENRPQVVKAMKTLLDQGDLADLAADDLRRWEVWDLTADVLKRYGQKGFDAPLVKRAILRYALCCKQPESTTFLKTRRAEESELVREVEESLKFEKAK
jgi:hypothetical protein